MGAINWAFADACEAASSVAEVAQMLARETRALGFSHFACASHVDPVKTPPDAVMMVDYPQVWLERFSSCNYAARDPVLIEANRRSLPFHWSDQEFRQRLARDQVEILREAADMGLGNGLTIPIPGRGALPASCSLVIGPDGVDPLKVRDAYWYALYAHERARRLLTKPERPRRPVLAPREKECLEWCARGKTDFEIGIILGLSEHTIHNAIRRVCAKYGAVSRMQAFARALADGEVRAQDVAG